MHIITVTPPYTGDYLFELASDFTIRSGHWGTALPLLTGLAIGINAKQLIEVGMWQGASTLALLAAADCTGGQLTSITNNRTDSLLPESHTNWKFHFGRIVAVAPDLVGPFDFGLLDGEHDLMSVREELGVLRHLMAKNSIIALDDCWDGYPGVLKAFNEFTGAGVEKSIIRYGTAKSVDGIARALGLIRFTT